MDNCFVCKLLNKEVVGTHIIEDAIEDPLQYNKQPLCDEHWSQREYMKHMDPDKYIKRIIRPEDDVGVVIYKVIDGEKRRVGVEKGNDTNED